MAYNFKNLNEVDRQENPTENTTVMAFENGNPKQIPASEFGGKGLVVDLRCYTLSTDGSPNIISDISYDPIYEAIMAGQNVVFQIQIDNGHDVFAEPVLLFMVPGQGFGIRLFSLNDTTFPIAFTNGSYHTA